MEKKPSLFVYDAVMTSLSYFVEHKTALIKNKNVIFNDFMKLFQDHEEYFNGRNTSKKMLKIELLCSKNFGHNTYDA